MMSGTKRFISVIAAIGVFAIGYTAGNIDNMMIDKNVVEISVSDKLSSVDFDTYHYPKEKFTFTQDESIFYDRLDSMARKYLVGNEAAAYMKGRSVYSMDGIQVDDLNLSESDLHYVTEFFMDENPQYYFLRNVLYLSPDGYFYVGLFDDFADINKRNSATNQLFDTLNLWLSECVKPDMSDLAKETAIYNFICDKLSYARNTYDQSLYSSVVLQQTVCNGYAQLFTAMCNASGIECMTVFNSTHAWNLVKLDEKWYIVDTTYGSVAGNRDKYLNKGSVSLSDSVHVASAFCIKQLPLVSDVDYAGSSGAASEDPSGGSMSESSQPSQISKTDLLPIGVSSSFDGQKYIISWSSKYPAKEYNIEIFDDTSHRVGSYTVQSTSYCIDNMDIYRDFTVKVRSVTVIGNQDVLSDYVYCFVKGQPKSGETQTQRVQPVITSVNRADASLLVLWKWEAGNTYNFELYTDAFCKSRIASVPNVSGCGLKFVGISSTDAFYATLSIRYRDGVQSDKRYFKLGTDSVEEYDISTIYTESVQPVNTVSGISVSNFTLSLLSASFGKYRFDWDAVQNTQYEFQISASSDFNSLLISTVLKSNSIVIRGMYPGTSYYVRVRLVDDSCNTSDWSTLSVH